MPFGQVVVGPPGSGKTTYCGGMHDFLNGIGRTCAVINLDPANTTLPYPVAVDIGQLVDLDVVQREEELGPNGGLVFAMEYLEQNLDWLVDQLKPLADRYLLFDFPGQVELYMHHSSIRNVLHQLQKLGYRLCAVHLVDAHYCLEPYKYMSALLVTLSSMLHMEMPQVNVMSKLDVLKNFGPLPLPLRYYSRVHELSSLLRLLNRGARGSTRRLNRALCELVDKFSDMLAFVPLSVHSKKRMARVLWAVDRMTGLAVSSEPPAWMQGLD